MLSTHCTRYGPPEVIQLVEVETPQPKAHELLIKVRATTVSSGDWRIRSLTMPRGFGLLSRLIFGVFKPRKPILGVEMSGEVVAVGSAVTRFTVGDAVFGMSGMAMGCHAEFKCMPQDGALALKPESLTWEHAAALSFGGTTAMDFFRRGGLKAGDRVLINGASGTVGAAAVQLARHAGAEVTAVCSTANWAMVQALGAHHVIDYTQQDFADQMAAYDIIMDTVGNAPFERCKPVLRQGGRFLMVAGSLPEMLAIPWVTRHGSHKIVAGPFPERAEDLRALAGLAQAGVLKPPIDSVYPFAQVVDAHRRVDSGRKRGSVVLLVG